MKKIFRISNYFIIFFVLAYGCTTPPKMYYWGDYSNSLYNYHKNTSEENLIKHKQVLEQILEESKINNLRVPPGVYAELGYIYFRQNDNIMAIKYFELEEEYYPESKILMQRLTQATKFRNNIPQNVDAQTTKEEK